MSRCTNVDAGSAPEAWGGAAGVGDAPVGGRHGVEPLGADGLATHAAVPVGASVESAQSLVDQFQLSFEHIGERSVLTLFGCHLASIGEVVVELELDFAADGEFVDAGEEVGSLCFELGAHGLGAGHLHNASAIVGSAVDSSIWSSLWPWAHAAQ